MSEPRNAWGFTLFADDLRHELGGKTSLMGMYQLDMIHNADFPITIPKFVMLIKYYEVKGLFNDDLNLKVFLPGDPEETPTFAVSISKSTRDDAATLYEADQDSERLFDLTMPIIMSPLVIKEEGFIKVRIQCGETTTRLGRIMIRKVRDADNIPVTPSPIVSSPPSLQSPPADPAS
jgi:hypothetical protein